jgi:hypothetical protein
MPKFNTIAMGSSGINLEDIWVAESGPTAPAPNLVVGFPSICQVIKPSERLDGLAQYSKPGIP